jgi:hypothetical protein
MADPASASPQASDCELPEVARHPVCKKYAEKMEDRSDGKRLETSPCSPAIARQNSVNQPFAQAHIWHTIRNQKTNLRGVLEVLLLLRPISGLQLSGV